VNFLGDKINKFHFPCIFLECLFYGIKHLKTTIKRNKQQLQ